MNKNSFTLLHSIFENQVNLTPNALAVKFNGKEYSYQQVEDKSNQVAHFLLSQGLQIEELVGIYFSRSELPIIAMLGILKAGGAYVPIDRTFPKERIKHIIQDAKIHFILTESKTIQELAKKTALPLVAIDSNEIKKMPSDRSFKNFVSVLSENLCYIIYTSGSTGKPKGVMTQHTNVVHFVNSFKEVCKLSSNDRLYNGFAYSFDGSVEEIWMAFSNGASLIIASDETTKLADDAAALIRNEKITFLSTVPTFLNMIKDPPRSLKLVILSGEVCPSELIDIWVSENRRLLNVYGPTETTVNTTYWECKKGEPVTIGKSIPDYTTYILDENKKPVKNGEKGELYIGGNGLAKGYLNLEIQTKECFLEGILESERLYKTGDQVSLDVNNNLIFHGRIDSQVKIRGFRIELSEIETILVSIPNVSNAVLTVTKQNDVPELAGYITTKNTNKPLNHDKILPLLKSSLPDYMIPSYLEVLNQMPRLPSGKIDRKKLPIPKTPLIANYRSFIPPSNQQEEILVEVWKEVFGLANVSTEDHFFNDLRGHSLLAAKATSIARMKYNFDLDIKDIYIYPSIKKLSENLPKQKEKVKDEYIRTKEKSGKQKHSWLMIFAQGISMYLLYAILAFPLFILFYYSIRVIQYEGIIILKVSLGTILLLLLYPSFLLLGISMKWLIIGRIKAGVYSLNSSYYFRWWLADRIQAITSPMLLSGSPLMLIYYRLMGAKIGKQSIIDTHLCSAWDLVQIGDNSTVGNETQLRGVIVENGLLKIGGISIGANCFVGIHSYLGINSRMEDFSKLGDISSLEEGDILKFNESKQGSPAINTLIKVPNGENYQSKPLVWNIWHMVALACLILFVPLSGIPSFFLVSLALNAEIFIFKALLLLSSGPLFVFTFCLLTAFIRKILFNNISPAVYKTESLFYIKKWFVDNLIRLSVVLIKPLYTTIYFPKWMRLLGANVGKNAEISTVSQFSPELMTIGEGSFFADGSIIGGRKFYNGYVEISKTSIGKRSFIGNSAILPVGTNIGDNCLLGVLSVPPLTKGTIQNNTDWLGSPSFNLPHRQKIENFSEQVLFKPSIKLLILRSIIDSLRILIPSTLQLIGILALIHFLFLIYSGYGFLFALVSFPLIRFSIAIFNSLMVIVVKWLFVGRIKPTTKPLWSTFVWENEAVNGAYESVMVPELAPLLGTPFYAIFLRLMGCKIGKNVFMGTTLFSEFDLVYIEDNVSLNAGVVIQNHLFEDRIMKVSSLVIKKNCSIGNMTVILYDTIINKHANIAPLSLIMKNEIIPSASKWKGIPCSQV